MLRKIKSVRNAEPTLEGAGVHLKRVFGYHQKPDYDPFLMLDDFRNDDPAKYLAGFPWHPHRGIETITYMLKGSAEHGDSLGNHGTIQAGEVQWMTAGNGIIHQEMPKPDPQGRMYGFQLWTNLPAKDKMCSPRYRDLRAGDMPVVETAEGSIVKIIGGEFQGTQGPVDDLYVHAQFWDVHVPAHTRQILPAPKRHTCFIYIHAGMLVTDGQQAGNTQLVLFADGDEILLETSEQACHFLYLCGQPLRESISWRGPIVMNTPEEIKLAFQELEKGTFIKEKGIH